MICLSSFQAMMMMMMVMMTITMHFTTLDDLFEQFPSNDDEDGDDDNYNAFDDTR